MMNVEQMDLFEALKTIENEIREASKEKTAPTVMKTSAERPSSQTIELVPPKPSTRFSLSEALEWLCNCFTNLFGIGQWVNVYTVTRAFGGRENGGWYYLKYECIASKQVLIWEADTLQKNWERQYVASHKWGDLFSKRGGQEVIVLVEKTRGARRTRSKPNYEQSGVYTFPYSIVQ